MNGLAPSAATRADLSGSSRGSPADALGDLRVTVRASPDPELTAMLARATVSIGLEVNRRMNPSRPPLVPSWDVSIVLAGLQRGPFEPLDSVELKFLSLKTALLTALTSIKRVGDLQAFSVSEECLVFGPVYSHVVLRPRPGYVPKVPTTSFHDQVVNLQALPSEEAVMITYNIYIVIRETGQFSSKGIINDFIGNLNRLTVSRRFTEQAV